MTKLFADREPVRTWGKLALAVRAPRDSSLQVSQTSEGLTEDGRAWYIVDKRFLTEEDNVPPEGFCWRDQNHNIVEVCNHARVHTRWWEPEQAVWREFWKVITDTHLLCTLYHDLLRGGWYFYRLYD